MDNDIVDLYNINTTIILVVFIRKKIYDGDTITCRGLYTDEANKEAAENINSKQNFINFGCAPVRMSTGDAITSLYALTKVLSDVNLTQNIQFK